MKEEMKEEMKLLGEYLDWVEQKATKENWGCKGPILRREKNTTYWYQENGQQFTFEEIYSKKYLTS